MKIVVYGGRRFGLLPRMPMSVDQRAHYEAKARREVRMLNRYLDDLHEETPISELIEGGATGADTFGKLWARKNGVPVTHVPADWDGPAGKGAGFVRNEQMARMKPDVGIECPGGNGTADMTRRLRKHGVEVRSLRL